MEKLVRTLVTTIDNPFNPFTQFDDWYRFDVEKGYNTCAYMARVANVTPEMTEAEEIMAINDVVDDICRLNITGMYKRVYET